MMSFLLKLICSWRFVIDRRMPPNVVIIVCNWNGGLFLEGCLNSIKSSDYKGYSVIVVDNGSIDGSDGCVRERFSGFNLIRIGYNAGFSKANNLAISLVEAEYVALLNPDTLVEPDWLSSLVGALQGESKAWCAASKILTGNPPAIDRAGDGYSRAGTGVLRGRGESPGACDRPEWVFGACAAAALYRTAVLREVGLFDEDFFLLFEDVDLSFRAQLKGYRCLFVPEAIVHHLGSASIVHDSRTSVYYGHRNLEWVYVQNMPRTLLLRTFVPHLLYNVLAFLYFLYKGRGRVFLEAKRDALKGLPMAMKKRRRVQEGKRVEDTYIWGLLEKERYIPRLRMRLRGSQQEKE